MTVVLKDRNKDFIDPPYYPCTFLNLRNPVLHIYVIQKKVDDQFTSSKRRMNCSSNFYRSKAMFSQAAWRMAPSCWNQMLSRPGASIPCVKWSKFTVTFWPVAVLKKYEPIIPQNYDLKGWSASDLALIQFCIILNQDHYRKYAKLLYMTS